MDKYHPEVQQRKRKSVADKPAQEATTFTWGLGQFQPDMPASEDETSTDLHIKWLQREFKKTGSDIDINNVDRKMGLTFAHRRKAIVADRIGVKELLDLYPWLHSRQEVYFCVNNIVNCFMFKSSAIFM